MLLIVIEIKVGAEFPQNFPIEILQIFQSNLNNNIALKFWYNNNKVINNFKKNPLYIQIFKIIIRIK
jgi:hypothetical protein